MKTESEKTLEKKLAREVEKVGGWSIKLLSTHVTGLPDRLCLFPGGRVCFVEVKTTGQKPRKIQVKTMDKLARLDFAVYVVACSEDIACLINLFKPIC